MLAKLGNGWTIDENKNNGKPYLSGTEPVAADPSLVDELGKYADTITVSANAADGVDCAEKRRDRSCRYYSSDHTVKRRYSKGLFNSGKSYIEAAQKE